jgi:hypothetical protein
MHGIGTYRMVSIRRLLTQWTTESGPLPLGRPDGLTRVVCPFDEGRRRLSWRKSLTRCTSVSWAALLFRVRHWRSDFDE